MQNENGFHFHALPAATQPARALIVVFHGFGNHPDQFVKWAKKTQKNNPQADVLIVRGPIPLNASPERKNAMRAPNVDDLYGWYSLADAQKAVELRQEFNAAVLMGKVNAFLDAQLKKRGLEDANLALIGFSQGGIVAQGASVRRQKPCAAVVSHSGAALPFNAAAAKPATLMIMGEDDDMFLHPTADGTPTTSVTLTILRNSGIKADVDHASSCERLRKAGVPVSEKLFPGQGHRVTETSWQAATDFVTRHLSLKP